MSQHPGKRRVSARAELSLRQRLSQREDRISELKEVLEGAQYSPRQRLASQHRSRSPSPSAGMPDHAAHHSNARSDNMMSNSHAVHHRDTRTSKVYDSQHAQHRACSPRAEQSANRNSPEYVDASNQHVLEDDQQQKATLQMQTARLPYFRPKSQEAAEDSQIISAHSTADLQGKPVKTSEAGIKQTNTARNLTGMSTGCHSLICSLCDVIAPLSANVDLASAQIRIQPALPSWF